MFGFFKRKPKVVAGSEWIAKMQDYDPWDIKLTERLPLTVIETKDGWVKYCYAVSLPGRSIKIDEEYHYATRENLFLLCHEPLSARK